MLPNGHDPRGSGHEVRFEDVAQLPEDGVARARCSAARSPDVGAPLLLASGGLAAWTSLASRVEERQKVSQHRSGLFELRRMGEVR